MKLYSPLLLLLLCTEILTISWLKNGSISKKLVSIFNGSEKEYCEIPSDKLNHINEELPQMKKNLFENFSSTIKKMCSKNKHKAGDFMKNVNALLYNEEEKEKLTATLSQIFKDDPLINDSVEGTIIVNIYNRAKELLGNFYNHVEKDNGIGIKSKKKTEVQKFYKLLTIVQFCANIRKKFAKDVEKQEILYYYCKLDVLPKAMDALILEKVYTDNSFVFVNKNENSIVNNQKPRDNV